MISPIVIIATFVVIVLIIFIFIALYFGNTKALNKLKVVYVGLLKKETSSKKEVEQENLDLKYLLQLSKLPILEQTLLVTTDDDERANIEEIIRIIKEVISNEETS